MPPELTLVALIAVPVVLLFVLRINAALAFLSLCLGDVLVRFSGGDAVSVVAGAGTGVHTTGSMIKLILLLAPMLLTMLFMIKTVKKSMKFFNAIPAIATGALTALLAVPLFTPGLQHNVVATGIWTQLQSFQSSIVAVGAVVCLLFLWMQRPKHEEKHGKKRKA